MIGEWISVADRLPPIQERPDGSDTELEYTWTDDVTVQSRGGQEALAYYCYDDKCWCLSELSGSVKFEVAQWRAVE